MEKSINGSCRLIKRLVIILSCLSYSFVRSDFTERTNINYVSAVGDPGMRNDNLRVAIEAWNQCNEVGEEATNMGSPRMADCFDIDNSSFPGKIIMLLCSYFSVLGLNSAFTLTYRKTNFILISKHFLKVVTFRDRQTKQRH